MLRAPDTDWGARDQFRGCLSVMPGLTWLNARALYFLWADLVYCKARTLVSGAPELDLGKPREPVSEGP